MDQPVVLSVKTLTAFLIATAILAAALAFAAVQFSEPSNADAASGNAAVVRQLKKANSKLSKINNNIGDFDYSGSSVRRNTKDTARATEAMCRAVASFPSSC